MKNNRLEWLTIYGAILIVVIAILPGGLRPAVVNEAGLGVAGIVLLMLALLMPEGRGPKTRATLVYLQSLTLPALLIWLLNSIALSWQRVGLPSSLVAVLMMILTPICFWLLSATLFSQIHAFWGRLIYLNIWFEVVLSMELIWDKLHLSNHGLLHILISSATFGALVFLGMGFILLKRWQIHWPMWMRQSGQKWSIWIGILLFSIAWVIFNGFNDGSSWGNILTSWSPAKHFSWLLFFMAVEAGVAEEVLHRGLILPLLARVKARWFQNRYLIVFTSGLIFGLFHLPNLLEQSLPATIDQMLFAMAAGWLFAALALYTGSVLYGMAFHFATDAVSFFASGSTTTGTPGLFDWEVTGAIMLVFALMAIWLLAVQRGQLTKQTLAKMRQ